MKFLAISDTHEKHGFLEKVFNEDIDVLIHSGDASNPRDAHLNQPKMLDFLYWYQSLAHIKHKIYVPGNHDTSIERGLIDFSEYPDITFLINESVIIEGIKIWGSPITPSFGHGWAYNCKRNKIEKYWNNIPNDTDILVTHGPPKGVLDATAYSSTSLIQVGCKTLLNKVKEIQPKFHIFGHIHDESGVYNNGTRTISGCNTRFINASCVNLMYDLVNDGIIFEI